MFGKSLVERMQYTEDTDAVMTFGKFTNSYCKVWWMKGGDKSGPMRLTIESIESLPHPDERKMLITLDQQFFFTEFPHWRVLQFMGNAYADYNERLNDITVEHADEWDFGYAMPIIYEYVHDMCIHPRIARQIGVK